jgi:hypothetical protein
MRIVVYADFILPGHISVAGAFYRDVLLETARRFPDLSIVLLTAKLPGITGRLPENVSVKPLKFPILKGAGSAWINKHLISKALKMHQADLYITDNLLYVFNLKTPCCFLWAGERGKGWNKAADLSQGAPPGLTQSNRQLRSASIPRR